MQKRLLVLLFILIATFLVMNTISATDQNITEEQNSELKTDSYSPNINEENNAYDNTNDMKNTSISKVESSEKQVKSATNSTTKKQPTLTINDVDTSEGLNVIISGVMTYNNEAIKGMKIALKDNETKYVVKTDENGYFSLDYEGNVGKNKLVVASPETTVYASTKQKITFKIEDKEEADIRLTGSEIHPGTKKSFVIILPEDSEGSVTLKIDNETIGKDIAIEYGMVIYSYDIPETYTNENYTLYLKYSGDEKYYAKSLNVTLTNTPVGGRVNATMSMNDYSAKYSSTKLIKVKLDKDAYGEVVFEIRNATRTVTGNYSESVKITNGRAILNYTANLSPGTYIIEAYYKGNYKYNPTLINSTLTIKKLKSSMKVANITSKAGAPTVFTVKARDELGNLITGMIVEFRLDGTLIGYNTTNDDGKARLYYTLPSTLYNKSYTINAKSNETTTTLNSEKNGTLTLKQLKTRVMVPNISTIPSKTTTISATIVDQYNNTVTKGVVVFKKNNITIGKAKVSDGYATYIYYSNYETTSLSYIYAYYTGDWKYASSKGRGTYKVTKLTTSTTSSAVDAKPNSKINISVRIKDENQQKVKDGNVTFKLNNKVLGTTEVSNGVARIRYTLKDFSAGTYRISCNYHGSNIYKSSSNTNTLTVTLYSTTTRGSSINAVVGNETSISVSVTDNEGYNVKSGTVKYYLESNYIGSAKVSNGIATLNYVVPSKYDGKIVKYYASYVKNGLYDSSSCSDTITVSHQKNVYVSPSGSDSNLGDEAHPFKTIEHALTHITLFGTVYLAPGTYSVSGLKINTSVSIIGSGANKTFIDGKNSGKTIFNMTKRNSVLTLNGVTIMNGKSNSEFSAGAIVTSSKLTITNSRFVNNTGTGAYSGGAIYTNGILNVTNTEFTNNKVTNVNSQGGAIRTYDNVTYISKCTFDSNKVTGSNTTGGSVIYSNYGDILINSTKFINNSATGKYVTGGVIRTIYGAVVIDKSTFTNNKVKATDYAMGGIVGSLSSGVSILNSKITSNTMEATNAVGGNLIYIETAVLEVNNTKINSNKLTSVNAYGGAIYGYYAVITITNSQLTSNNIIATQNGFGGAIYIQGGNISIDKTNFTSNTVKANSMALAGAIYSYSDLYVYNSNFVKNTINATNLGGGAIANMGNLTANNTNFINNDAYNCGNAITATNSSRNVIENNYWGETSPTWNKTLYSVKTPKVYSKTKINN